MSLDTLGTPRATPRRLDFELPNPGPTPPSLPTLDLLNGASPQTPQSPSPPQPGNGPTGDIWERSHRNQVTTTPPNVPAFRIMANPSNAPPSLQRDPDAPPATDPPRTNPRKPTLQMLAASGGIRPRSMLNSQSTEQTRLAKFLQAEMPKIQDAHPSALVDLINRDLLIEWDTLPEGRLAIIPFGIEIRSYDQLQELRDRIFTTVAEISQAQKLGVAVPEPNERAMTINRFPTTFMAYNLSEEQCKILQQRTVWSSPDLTFRVASTDPCRPDFLFALTDFTNLDPDDVRKLVLRIWTDDKSHEFFTSLTHAMETDENAPNDLKLTQLDIQAFLRSIQIKVLKLIEKPEKVEPRDKRGKRGRHVAQRAPPPGTKKPPPVLKPRFYIYADSSHIKDFQIWAEIRHFLANRSYQNSLLGRGKILLIPHNCGICHGADHPRGMCPFPELPGWQGPKRKMDESYNPMDIDFGDYLPRAKRARLE